MYVLKMKSNMIFTVLVTTSFNACNNNYDMKKKTFFFLKVSLHFPPQTVQHCMSLVGLKMNECFNYKKQKKKKFFFYIFVCVSIIKKIF